MNCEEGIVCIECGSKLKSCNVEYDPELSFCIYDRDFDTNGNNLTLSVFYKVKFICSECYKITYVNFTNNGRVNSCHGEAISVDKNYRKNKLKLMEN